MSNIATFEQLYRRSPAAVSFCPYRVCPMGAHSDHNFGKITGLAIDKGVSIAYGPKKNGVIEMSSLQFERRAQWHIHQIDERPVGDWADYLRGATWALSKHYPLTVGMCGVVEIDGDDKILSMEEKPAQPRSHWCCPPFYVYSKADAKRVKEAIEGKECGTDAPGSFIAWLSGKTAVHAMEMPGSRYDIGNLQSYEQVQNDYRGIVK